MGIWVPKICFEHFILVPHCLENLFNVGYFGKTDTKIGFISVCKGWTSGMHQTWNKTTDNNQRVNSPTKLLTSSMKVLILAISDGQFFFIEIETA